MASNLTRFEKDLNRLVENGQMLEYAMIRDVDQKSFDEQIKEQIKDEERIEKFIKDLPSFYIEYEKWYSESIVIIKQLIPDRLANFISLYEKPKTRKEVEYGNYVIQDFLQGLHVTLGGRVKVDKSAALPQFKQQLSILKAAKQRFASSLFEIRQMVQADLFDSEIDAARELLKNKFYRAAGAVSGVVLEKHLQQVCSDHNISVKKNPGISVLSEALKSNAVIDVPQWRHISMLGDIRNICDHNKSDDPTQQQIQDLIDGTDKILKTVY